MSISVAITRRAEPLADDEPGITAAEWLAVADEEPDFRVPAVPEREGAGADARVWTGHPSAPIVFDLCDGQVEVVNPDAGTIARMQALARRLDARVVSENGEIFDDAGASLGFLPGYP